MWCAGQASCCYRCYCWWWWCWIVWLYRRCPANGFKEDADSKYVTQAEGIPDGWLGLDVGTKSTARFVDAVSRANTILWNGPMGVIGKCWSCRLWRGSCV